MANPFELFLSGDALGHHTVKSVSCGDLINPGFTSLLPHERICELWPSTARNGRRNANVSNLARLNDKHRGVVIKKHRMCSKRPKPRVIKSFAMICAKSCIAIVKLL